MLAPVPALPIATAVDKLPVAKLKLPKNFNVEIYAAGLTNAGHEPFFMCRTDGQKL